MSEQRRGLTIDTRKWILTELRAAGPGGLTTRNIIDAIESAGWKTRAGRPVSVVQTALCSMARRGEVTRSDTWPRRWSIAHRRGWRFDP